MSGKAMTLREAMEFAADWTEGNGTPGENTEAAATLRRWMEFVGEAQEYCAHVEAQDMVRATAGLLNLTFAYRAATREGE